MNDTSKLNKEIEFISKEKKLNMLYSDSNIQILSLRNSKYKFSKVVIQNVLEDFYFSCKENTNFIMKVSILFLLLISYIFNNIIIIKGKING